MFVASLAVSTKAGQGIVLCVANMLARPIRVMQNTDGWLEDYALGEADASNGHG
jgi:hypothetical protein